MTKNKPVKARRIKARLMWEDCTGDVSSLEMHPSRYPRRVAVLCMENPDALVEQVARALYVDFNGDPGSFPEKCGIVTANAFFDKARVAMASLDILRSAKRNSKRKGKAK